MSLVPGVPRRFVQDEDLTGTRATVMGLGHFGGGVETTRWLVARGADVTVTDLLPESDLPDSLRALDGLRVRLRLGSHDPRDFIDTDLVVASPAVPPESPFLAMAVKAGVPLMTELGITMSLVRGKSVWITGTCGKSTTTALLGEMLEHAGLSARVGGNIGRPLIGVSEEVGPSEIVVLEVSSFQLEWMKRDGISPDLAVVTNVTPNHLDRHGTFERYLEAKRAALPPDGIAVLNFDDPVSRDRLGDRAARVHWTSLAGEPSVGFRLEGDTALEAGFGEIFMLGDVRLLGEFNRMNALQAAAAARLLGAGVDGIRSGLRSFSGLPHRLEDIGVRDGVRGVNDSKATTPEAAMRALAALEGGIVLIAGGFERGADLSRFARAARERARGVVLMGESAARVEAALGDGGPPRRRAASIEEAVEVGLGLCREGDHLLLSPGHASWDSFAHYEERGERFRRAFFGGILREDDRPLPGC